jgi:hypothetical protein
MVSQDEQRHHDRHRPNGVNLTLRRERAPADGETLHLSCRDISRAGLGVEFPYSIPPDTDVELWVSASGEPPLHLFGTVAWCAAPRGRWQAGIALDLERSDGGTWAARFDE